jgi:hypothetical protein
MRRVLQGASSLHHPARPWLSRTPSVPIPHSPPDAQDETRTFHSASSPYHPARPWSRHCQPSAASPLRRRRGPYLTAPLRPPSVRAPVGSNFASPRPWNRPDIDSAYARWIDCDIPIVTRGRDREEYARSGGQRRGAIGCEPPPPAARKSPASLRRAGGACANGACRDRPARDAPAIAPEAAACSQRGPSTCRGARREARWHHERPSSSCARRAFWRPVTPSRAPISTTSRQAVA